MTWFCLDLGNGMDAYAPTQRVQAAFMAVFLREPAGSGRAVFSRHNSRDDSLQVYFTPETADIARQFNARPCPKPSTADGRISLLAGDADALALRFPEQGPDRGQGGV